MMALLGLTIGLMMSSPSYGDQGSSTHKPNPQTIIQKLRKLLPAGDHIGETKTGETCTVSIVGSDTDMTLFGVQVDPVVQQGALGFTLFMIDPRLSGSTLTSNANETSFVIQFLGFNQKLTLTPSPGKLEVEVKVNATESKDISAGTCILKTPISKTELPLNKKLPDENQLRTKPGAGDQGI